MSPLPEASGEASMDTHPDLTVPMTSASVFSATSQPAVPPGTDAVDWFVQMQFDMLRKESAELSSKLDTMTAHLRDAAPGVVEQFEPRNQPCEIETIPAPPGLYSHPERVGKAPMMKTVHLDFDGHLTECDKAAVSAKLLHLRRILHRRLEAGLSPTPQTLSSVLDVLLMLQGISARAERERIRVLTCCEIAPDQQAALRDEIISLVSFTQSLDLDADAVTFTRVAASSPGMQGLVLIVGFNSGESGADLKPATLTELAELDAIPWAEVCSAAGAGLRLAWACKADALKEQPEGMTVRAVAEGGLPVGLYFPEHLQRFLAERAAEERGRFVRDVLADHVDASSYLEWEEGGPAGDARGGIAVPALMPEWVAKTVWGLAQRGDAWLAFMTAGPHALRAVRLDGVRCDLEPRAAAGKVGIKQLLFELERQQELIRRKLASLERLMKCKQFVAHMEAFTMRLQSHAEELFSGIRIKQETPNTLDALCSQLSSLSVQCGLCIDQAMSAVEAVGEAPLGEEVVLQQQVSKILQAKETKLQVDRLKDQVEGALAQKQKRASDSDSPLSSSPAQPPPAFAPPPPPPPPAAVAPVRDNSVDRAHAHGDTSMEMDGAGGGERRMVMEMLEQLEKGIQVQKEQQEQLVEYWLGQHAKMKSELSSLLSMANAAANVESIGITELQGRYQQYIDFLEEHEQVEDTMLFPLVKTLFPQSAQAVDAVLDPQRHKGVDALHERVGRQLQQLHDRHRAGEEMVQDSDEMRKVVESLERLNDYMVGHIRYEEEVAMPWLGAGSSGRPGPEELASA